MHIKRNIPTPCQLNHEMLPRNLVIFMIRGEIVSSRLKKHSVIKGLPKKSSAGLLLIHVDISSALLLPHGILLSIKSRDARRMKTVRDVTPVGKAELNFGIERLRMVS